MDTHGEVVVPIGLADAYAISTLSVPYQAPGVRFAYILAGDCGEPMAESWRNFGGRSRFVDLTFAPAKRSFGLSPPIPGMALQGDYQ